MNFLFVQFSKNCILEEDSSLFFIEYVVEQNKFKEIISFISSILIDRIDLIQSNGIAIHQNQYSEKCFSTNGVSRYQWGNYCFLTHKIMFHKTLDRRTYF